MKAERENQTPSPHPKKEEKKEQESERVFISLNMDAAQPYLKPMVTNDSDMINRILSAKEYKSLK